MSSIDTSTIIAQVITGVFTIIGVMTGIYLTDTLSKRRQQTDIERKIILIEHQIFDSLSALLHHVGFHHTDLEPLRADRLEASKPHTIKDFSSILQNSLKAFPFPTASENLLVTDIPRAYVFIPISRFFRNQTIHLNELAAQLKSDKQPDSSTVANFVATAQSLISPEHIIDYTIAQFRIYAQILAEHNNTTIPQKKLNEAIEELRQNLSNDLTLAQQLSDEMSKAQQLLEEYLKRIGWS